MPLCLPLRRLRLEDRRLPIALRPQDRGLALARGEAVEHRQVALAGHSERDLEAMQFELVDEDLEGARKQDDAAALFLEVEDLAAQVVVAEPEPPHHAHDEVAFRLLDLQVGPGERADELHQT